MELHISISCDLHKSLVSPSEPARSGAAACLALGRCLLARPPHSPMQSVARAAAAASSPHTVAAGFLLRRPTEKGEGGTQGENAPRFMCALLIEAATADEGNLDLSSSVSTCLPPRSASDALEGQGTNAMQIYHIMYLWRLADCSLFVMYKC
ncbi:hypothetical protein PVAP13_3NG139200 [Panicum virgatum]|uniref:Uncharacterized protein n=1 Tax=Panicum virgatum TaxID=38727 RepID=A0A8T0UD42_PANVG|nr:hypothetical protein PVAP13_3NG139200 [Panicum virgatum]